MKKKLTILVAAVCALALSLALFGCGGGSKEDAAKNFVGNWKVTAVDDSSGSLAQEDLELMEAFGLSIVLTLNEDGTCTMNMMGEQMSGTWSAKSATECDVTIDGSAVTAMLNGTELSMEQDGSKLVFTKITDDEASQLASGGSDSSSNLEDDFSTTHPFVGTVIADDDVCSIVITSAGTDWAGDSGFNATVTNKLDKAITVTVPPNVTSVDGKMIELYGTATLQPNTYQEDVFFYFFGDELGGDIDAVTNVKSQIEVLDYDTYDELGVYDVVL